MIIRNLKPCCDQRCISELQYSTSNLSCFMELQDCTWKVLPLSPPPFLCLSSVVSAPTYLLPPSYFNPFVVLHYNITSTLCFNTPTVHSISLLLPLYSNTTPIPIMYYAQHHPLNSTAYSCTI